MDERKALQLADITAEFDRTVIGSLMMDPSVTDIVVNGEHGNVWADFGRGTGLELVAANHLDVAKRVAIIYAIAGIMRPHPALSRENPILSTELPQDGSRVEAWLDPITRSPSLHIRFHRARGRTLEQYEADGTISPAHLAAIREAIARRSSIVTSGSWGTGKTTVLGAILAELARLFPAEYLVTIEDTYELQSPSLNWSALKTTEHVDALKLFQRSLKARPDRIVLGEIVDHVAHPFLQSLDAGQRGLTTIHADSIEDVCWRLQSLAGNYPGVNHEHDPWRIVKNVHLIVYCAKDGETRRVSDVARIASYEGNGKYTLAHVC